jgi:Hemerythrin HHE cation binding domain
MPRADLYTPIHKAIRAVLFDTASRLGRTSFADRDEATAIAASLRQLFGWLDEHAAHEDAVVLPELQRVAPELYCVLQGEHSRIDGMQRDIEALLPRLATADAAERQALGQRLHHKLHRLIAAQLDHLEREEVEANRALWAHFDDAGLQALHARIMARIAPPRVAAWLELMLPALSRTERQGLLADLQRKLPDGAFTVVTAPARAALGEGAWRAAIAVA